MSETRGVGFDHAHFASISWCARHLHGLRVVTRPPSSRHRKSNGEDAFFAETLKTQSTISAMLEVFEDPPSPLERIDHVKTFLTLGSGLNGHAGICHGGLVTTILDEVIGLLIPINKGRNAIPNTDYMTAYLNTTFFRPVPTSTTILAQARIVRAEGRKYYTEATIENKDGEVLARADALYVGRRSRL
ncbi:thioesterase superfamily protein [Biscogniauxia marginata]|nr:thioesterase superfamily protein [Biscogniauxia marginata]